MPQINICHHPHLALSTPSPYTSTLKDTSMDQPLVELKDITKSYGNVNALSHVTMHVNKAEIVGLIGDNGAGKSTLIKILSGVHSPDSGELWVRGKRVEGRWTVAKAHAAGIETVHQD